MKKLLIVMLTLTTVYCGKDSPTAPEPENNPPVISSISASPALVKSGEICTLTIVAIDADGDDLTYTWSSDHGAFTSTTGDSVQWTAPGTGGNYTVTCTVDDGTTTDTESETITVIAPDGEIGTVTDIDGNVYQTVIIGYQEWTVSNLKVTHYSNGDSIPNVTDDSKWSSLIEGAIGSYGSDDGNVTTYGYLYNWHAVNDSRGLAPDGWHVPTDDEWKELEMYLGMSQSQADSTGFRGTDEGGKLKEAGTDHWAGSNYGATNESGFTALPGGRRRAPGGGFNYIGSYGYYWSSTESISPNAWSRTLFYSRSTVNRYDRDVNFGYSVRLVRDK